MPNDAGSTKRRAGLWSALATSTTLVLAGCSGTGPLARLSSVEPLERVVGPHDKVTPGGGRYQVGKPYSVAGRTYVPREDPNLDETGVASWYGGDYHHGTRTANGEVVDRGAITAAHRTMPLPSYARVTSLATGRSIIVRVNDRGPYADSRVIDLSEKTAELLDIKRRGVSRVRVQYIGRAGLGGSDQRSLMASLRGPDVAPGVDDRTALASADLPVGPRRAQPAPTMVADATPARPVNVVAAVRPPQPVSARALAATQDPLAFDLAGVDARAMREAARAPLPKPAATSAEVIEAEMPGAFGAPMSLTPPPVGSYDTSALPTSPNRHSSFGPEPRVSAAFDRLERGEAPGRTTR
jgi:rare lipoprotein A